MAVTVALAVVLVAVVLAATLRLRAAARREQALDAGRARHEHRADALEREAARYRGLLDRAGDWIWTIDGEGTLTFSNPAGAELLGHQQLVGRSALELTHPDDRPSLTAPDGWAGVVRRQHADGSWRTVDTRSVAVDGGWLGIDRDLTAPSPAPPGPERGIAVVRWPIVDGRREVVGYELVAAGDVLEKFAPAELLELGGGRPVWISTAGPVPDDLPKDKVVLQLAADTDPERAAALAGQGYGLAIEDYQPGSPLLEHCGIVKVGAWGRDDEELGALLAEPAARGLVLVATGVATADELTRCRVLGFSHFQGEFFARPRGGSGASGMGGLASLQALRELTSTDASFEQIEQIIGADVGLSIGLLRHVNSAFFALPRKIDTVREALTLLGTRAVRRWATVTALSAVPDAPDQLIALALLRGRMCELLGRADGEAERERLFTVGLFSVADALLDAPMEEVLATLPFSPEMQAALVRHEGRHGQVLSTVLRYELGHFPDVGGDVSELAGAYLAALKWADDAGRWLS